jgi:hypothetical protein
MTGNAPFAKTDTSHDPSLRSLGDAVATRISCTAKPPTRCISRSSQMCYAGSATVTIRSDEREGIAGPMWAHLDELLDGPA